MTTAAPPPFALGSAELRVAAAEDVLSQIMPNIEPTTQDYVLLHEGEPCYACVCGSLFLALASERLLGNTDENDLASYRVMPRLVRPEPLLVKDIVETLVIGRSALTDDDIKDLLEVAFSQEQLQLIEIAFMQGYAGDWAQMRFDAGGQNYYRPDIIWAHWSQTEISNYFSPEAQVHWARLERARTFVFGYPHERLRAIMENIIANEGEFIP